MPLFETTIPVDEALVAKVVKQNWNITLGKLLKASQNHTFEAFSEDESKKYSVRVTPDPEHKHLQRITDELTFVSYLVKAGLNHICPPIPPITNVQNTIFLLEQNFIIVVFEWAKGVPLPFIQFRWMNDKAVIYTWGKFLAQMHKRSRQFGDQFPQVAKRIQNWDQVHSGILKGIKLHPLDEVLKQNPEHFGVFHGDLNMTNFHYVAQEDTLSVFDTDQVQRGFFLWDVSQAIFTTVMLEDGGMPCSGTPVEGVNRKQFQERLVEGYESEGVKIDRQRLYRMIDIRKQFYIRFSKKAVEEGNSPPDMAPFLKYICDFLGQKWTIKEQ